MRNGCSPCDYGTLSCAERMHIAAHVSPFREPFWAKHLRTYLPGESEIAFTATGVSFVRITETASLPLGISNNGTEALNADHLYLTPKDVILHPGESLWLYNPNPGNASVVLYVENF